MVLELSGQDKLEIAHVLFVDMVGYSQLPMGRQKEMLRQLQESVRSGLCATLP